MTVRRPLVLVDGREKELPTDDTLDFEIALSGSFVEGSYDLARSNALVSFNPDLDEATFPAEQAIAQVTPEHGGGLRYLEVTFVSGADSGNAAVGVVGPASTLDHQIGYDGAADEVGMFQNTGRIYANGVLIATNGTFFDFGDVIGMAVNATTRRVWFRVNGGNWNGSAANSPVTGVGGVDIAGTGDIYAAVCSDEVSTFRVNVAAELAGATQWGMGTPTGVVTPQDVLINNPTAGQTLRYDGTAWINTNEAVNMPIRLVNGTTGYIPLDSLYRIPIFTEAGTTEYVQAVYA